MRTVLRVTILFLLLILLGRTFSPAQAQEGYFWSDPVLLFEVEDEGELHYPIIIPDEYGNIHVFWNYKSGTPDDLSKIYYMRKDSAGWTFPVDIIATNPLSDVNVTIGQDGFFYLTWQGGGDTISFSRAPVLGAEFVKNWSTPAQITGATSFYSSLTTSPSGDIYLAYPGRGNAGVLLQLLPANGLSWSSPRTIALNSMVNTGADYVQIAASRTGILHVAWTEFYAPNNWPPRGIFYTRSEDGGESWSTPFLLAGDGADQVNLLAWEDQVHVAWNGMVTIGGRYYRWSSDGGQTWSETIEAVPPGTGGTEGFPQIVGDAAGTLHMLTTYNGCAWYKYFRNQIWSSPVCIAGKEALASNFIEEPALALSEGNKLHAVFWDGRKRLWYTTRVINAPSIPPKPLEEEIPTPEQEPAFTATPATLPTAIPTRGVVIQDLGDDSSDRLDTGRLLVLSLSPVIGLIVVIGAIKYFKRKK